MRLQLRIRTILFAVVVLAAGLAVAGLRPKPPRPAPAGREVKAIDPIQITLKASSPQPGFIALEADFTIEHFARDAQCWPAAWMIGPWPPTSPLESVSIVWRQEWPELVALCRKGKPTRIHLPRQLIPVAPGRYRVFVDLREDASRRTPEGELLESADMLQSAQEWVTVAASRNNSQGARGTSDRAPIAAQQKPSGQVSPTGGLHKL
jgi:hypothetical protein